jgi:hypothetical protein
MESRRERFPSNHQGANPPSCDVRTNFLKFIKGIFRHSLSWLKRGGLEPVVFASQKTGVPPPRTSLFRPIICLLLA